MPEGKKSISRQVKVPVGYIIATSVVIVVLVIVCMVLAKAVSNKYDEVETPETPDEPETSEFIEEGERIALLSEGNYSELEEYQFVNSREDIDEYFGENDDAFLEYVDNVEGNVDIYGTHLLVKTVNRYCGGSIEAVGISKLFNNHSATVTVEQNVSCGPCAPEYIFWLIPIEDYDIYEINIEYNIINSYKCDPHASYKPVIYLYPEADTEVNVELGAKEKLLVSYPTYIDGWNVLARKDGTLKDLDTGRELYSLYYEAENTVVDGLHEVGFVVKGSDTAKFLEEKLAILGLNAHESEEFIIYWLPKMQDNAYNYIYFAIGAEVAENMPISVSPAPDTVIRINMEWKSLDEAINIKHQTLPSTPERKGFTLVEWGGTILE